MLRSFIFLQCLMGLVGAGRPSSGATEFLNRINRNADPCDDFYEFACGRYVEETEVPGDLYWESTYAQTKLTERRIIAALSKRITRRDIEAVKKAKLLFRSCMCFDKVESDAIPSALDYLQSVGGTWPTFDDTWTDAGFDLASSLAAANRLDSFDLSGSTLGPFVRVIVLPDPTIPKPNNRVHLVRPNFLAPLETLDANKIEEFKKLIVDTLVLLGADEATAAADGNAVASFELALQALPIDTGTTPPQPLSVVNLALPYLDWIDYLNEIFNEDGITFDETDLVIPEWLYYFSLGGILGTTDARTLANDIKWRMFTQLLPAMPDSIRERYREFENLCTGVETLPNRKSHCARVVNGNDYNLPTNYGMTHAVSRLFVKSYMTPAMKRMNMKIGAEVKAAYKEVIEDNDWLTDQTRDYILRKIDAQTEEYVAPDTTFDDIYLNVYYRDFNIEKRKFMENFISTVEGISRRSRESLGEQDENTWLFPPSVSSGFSDETMNMVGLTAALLQPKGTFFDLKYPSAYNFAGSGFSVARGTTWNIGVPGFSFNEEGVMMSPTYSLISLAKYAQRLFCLEQQYDDYVWPFTSGAQIMPLLTRENDAADLDGLRIAYRAFEKFLQMKGGKVGKGFPYNDRQVFFISYAQNFCEVMRPKLAELWSQTLRRSPGKWRANGPLRNFPDFAEVFNCTAGSFMTLSEAERCEIF